MKGCAEHPGEASEIERLPLVGKTLAWMLNEGCQKKKFVIEDLNYLQTLSHRRHREGVWEASHGFEQLVQPQLSSSFPHPGLYQAPWVSL